MSVDATKDPTLTMAQRIANAAGEFQQRRTGLAPGTVTVVLSNQTLVITLERALSMAEKTLARTTAGAEQVREFHRQLFAAAAEPLRQEIKRITGVAVCEAGAEVEPAIGAAVHVFTTGTMVQVFLLAECISQDTWNAGAPVSPP